MCRLYNVNQLGKTCVFNIGFNSLPVRLLLQVVLVHPLFSYEEVTFYPTDLQVDCTCSRYASSIYSETCA